MKVTLTIWCFFFVLWSTCIQAANECKLKISYGLIGNESEIKRVNKGVTITYSRSHVRRVFNQGSKDANILVKGLASAPAWHRVNVGESYIGAVDLKKIKCLTTMDGPRPVLEQIEDRANTEMNLTAKNIENMAHEAQRVGEELSNIALDWLSNPLSDQWLSIGKAANCATNLGNQDNQTILNLQGLRYKGARANRSKFNNLVLQTSFSDMNNYLLMQASNKTYYHQLKYGFDTVKRQWNKARNEKEFRCAATELFKYWGFNEVLFANGTLGGNAIIGIDNKKVVIAVRGTQDPSTFTRILDSDDQYNGTNNAAQHIRESFKGTMDVLVNMGHVMVPANGLGIANSGKVHLGYGLAALELNSLIDLVAKKYKLKSKHIFVSGHSLGGATATVLARRMKNQGYPISASYVFAPPKVGDENFTKDLRANLNLYVTWNYRDPVPTFLNSQTLKFGTTSITGIDKFRATWEGAKKFIFFDQRHYAHTYTPQGNNHHQIFLDVREKQGAPYPEVFFQNGPLSEEWYFHNGNFYTAFTYDNLLKTQKVAKEGTGIEPEFNKELICLFWNYSFKPLEYEWNNTYKRFTRDKQGYPMQHCMW